MYVWYHLLQYVYMYLCILLFVSIYLQCITIEKSVKTKEGEFCTIFFVALWAPDLEELSNLQ